MKLQIPSALDNYIDGRFLPPQSGQFTENKNPATGEKICLIPLSGAADVDAAVVAAEAAFEIWSTTPAEKKFAVLNRIADLIDANAEELARAESIDNGKPLSLSRKMDIPRASANFRFFATAVLHFASESHAIENRGINYTLRRPIGLVGCISPWNLPLYLFTWKIAPALAAGNCVIAKPSEVTPVTAALLAMICDEAGLPPGVLNIVHGNGPDCGEAIVRHPKIRAISFTGSTRAGERIAAIAAPMFKKLSLELGGKNPAIIFEDCDWDRMMETTLKSSFMNQGQICLCGSRILVQRSVYEKFKTEFVKKAAALVVGDPLDEKTEQGAIVSEMHFEKIKAAVESAKAEGGRVLCGGHVVQGSGKNLNGYFYQPTVIEGLDQKCTTNREEIFGPVVTLQPFDTEEEAIALANAVDYGLAATIWSTDISIANRVAAKVDAGVIWINCWLLRDLRTAFGGMKNSGVGREGGWEAMRFFTEAKNICVEF